MSDGRNYPVYHPHSGYAMPQQQWREAQHQYSPSSSSSYHSLSPVSPHEATITPNPYNRCTPYAAQQYPDPSHTGYQRQHNRYTLANGAVQPQPDPRMFDPHGRPSPTSPQSNFPYSQYPGQTSSSTFQSNGYAPNQSAGYGTEPSYEQYSEGGSSYGYSDRPFACDMCTLSFNRGHDLKRHRETHRGDKPFSCNGGCGKTFTRKDALKRHQIVKNCGTMESEN